MEETKMTGELTQDGQQIEWESDAGRQWRAKECARGVRQLLDKYECILNVPTIDISTGRFIPIPQIQPAAIKKTK